MEYCGMVLHNTDHLVYDVDHKDYQICRMPDLFRQRLNLKAQKSTLFVSGCELRFIMEDEQVSIGLRRMPVHEGILPQGVAQIYQGDFQGSYPIGPQAVSVEGSQVVIRRQDLSHIQRFAQAETASPGRGFSPEVTRVLLPYDWGCFLGNVKGAVRPPEPGMVPEKRLLFYGSSISHGGNASLMAKTWAFRLAESLGWDSINLGCAGSAWMDEAMSQWIAERDDWDAAVFELGINVISLWTPSRLYEEALSFIRRVKAAHPEKPVFVADMFYSHHDFSHNPAAADFRQAIESCVRKLALEWPELYYINGLEVMGEEDGFCCLSSDGLHPSDLGHEVIGRRMKEKIEPCLPGKNKRSRP